jgi:hypothetical protein
LIHHDKVSAHTLLRISQFLVRKDIADWDHPPYFPDLAPANFWLFSKLKEWLKGKRFSDVENTKSVKKITIPFKILETVFHNG